MRNDCFYGSSNKYYFMRYSSILSILTYLIQSVNFSFSEIVTFSSIQRKHNPQKNGSSFPERIKQYPFGSEGKVRLILPIKNMTLHFSQSFQFLKFTFQPCSCFKYKHVFPGLVPAPEIIIF